MREPIVTLDEYKMEREFVDTLLRDYTNIYQELEQSIAEHIDGDRFILEMYRLLVAEYPNIWKEL